MADFLKTFIEGEDILASDANSNNQFLLSKLSDNAAQVQNYVESEISTMKSNIASVQATLQASIDALETKIDGELQSRTFVEASRQVGTGTTDLSTYLPDDNFNYLVWIEASFWRNGGSEGLMYTSDLLTTPRALYYLDGDAGRSSRGLYFGPVPVGAGRKITFSGSANYIYLVGYSKL